MRSRRVAEILINPTIATVLLIAPNLLALVRIAIAFAYATWGSAPATSLWIAIIFIACSTALIDGRLERCLGTGPSIGGVMDTIGDKILVLLIFLKLSAVSQNLTWVVFILVFQYALVILARILHVIRLHHIPVPDATSHASAIVGLLVALYCTVHPSSELCLLLGAIIVGANLIHIATAWLDAFSARHRTIISYSVGAKQ